MRERTNYQIRSDLNVESGDMNLWDDARIVDEAIKAACWFSAYVQTHSTIETEKQLRRWRPLKTLLGWCMANKDKIHFAWRAK